MSGFAFDFSGFWKCLIGKNVAKWMGKMYDLSVMKILCLLVFMLFFFVFLLFYLHLCVIKAQ